VIGEVRLMKIISCQNKNWIDENDTSINENWIDDSYHGQRY